MKYTTGQYAEALMRTLEDKTGSEAQEAIRRFLAIVSRNRDTPRLSTIVKAFERKQRAKAGLKTLDIATPQPMTPVMRKEVLAAFNGKAALRQTVDPELIAGIRIVVDDELLIDASGKRQIERMLAGQRKQGSTS